MRIRTAKELGLSIREQRRKLKLDQQTLAERAGVSRQWIVEVEHGKPRAELALVLRTLGVLGFHLDLSAASGAGGDRTGKKPATDATSERPEIDVDALIERAARPRGKP